MYELKKNWKDIYE